jgi:hypothetical protein
VRVTHRPHARPRGNRARGRTVGLDNTAATERFDPEAGPLS